MAARRPNVLFITCDQWRGDTLGAAGHPVVRTPNTDALAAEGTAFLRHHGGAAPCSPARACLYTGLYQMTQRVCRNGSPLDARFDNVALAARRLGYDPTLFGYTDVAPDPRRHAPGDPLLRSYEGVLPGFTVRLQLPEHQKPWLSWLRARGKGDGLSYPDIHRPAGGGAARLTSAPPVYDADETPGAFLTGEFLRWLSERDAGEPWFAHLSYLSPHPPFVVPAPYNTMYDPDDGPDFRRLASPEAEAGLHPFLGPMLTKSRLDNFIPGMKGRTGDLSGREFRQIRAIYWGMVSETDAQLGRVFDGVKAAGAWQDTVVVLTSDHAEMMGDHFLLGKGGWFDGSYHIPLVIRDPRRKTPAGRRIERFTEAVDVLPTLLDLLGAEVPPHLDGRKLTPFLDGKTPDRWRTEAHWEFDYRGMAGGETEARFGLGPRDMNLAVLRGERFKYVHFGGGLPPLLFDMESDPGELTDLSRDPAHLATRLEMAERLLAWRARHLDQSLALSELTERGVAGTPARLPDRFG